MENPVLLIHSPTMVPLANPPMKMYSFFFVLVLTFTCATATTVVTSRSRRTLHEPFFPQDAPVLPPVEPPALPPSSPPSLNVPFLSTPTKTPPSDEPFFPAFPSPPPPPPSASSSVSFPANISALNLPTSPEPKHVSSKLVPVGITLAIAAVVVLSIVVFLRIKKRRYHDDSQSFTDEKPQRSYNNSVFSATANNGGGGSGGGNTSYNRIPKLNRPSQTSSEFLYLGTLVNSHGGIDATGTGGRDNRGDEDSGLQKLGSPELRPLPPLSGSCGGRSQTILQNGCYETSEVESRDEEFDEFYSPRASDGGGSGGRRAFKAAAAPGNYQPRRSIGSGSSSSYSSSSSGSPARSISLSISPPVSLSPRHSRLKSPDLVAIQTAPPPSRPPPPPPLPPHPLIIPSPDVGLSKDSFESSPRLSNSSNDQNSPLARIPPPPQPPTKLREIPIPTTPAPATRLNPPVLIKPARHVPITSHQPMISPTEMLPENQESLETNEKTTPKPKLKPLHWDKVRASSDREMVWDHLKSSSFKLNEEMIETLFIVKPPNANSNEKLTIKRQILSSTISHENQVLDPKKSQNIAITLRALSVTPEEVCDALLEGNVDALGTELLESLMKMAPTKDEEHKLQEHKDDSLVKLGQAEKFLKAILDVPFAFRRIGAMLFVSNFDSEVEYLKQSFQTLEVACEELRNSRMFLKLLEAVLKTGNRMNVGTNRGDAHAFKLDSLLKLIDVKGTDGKTTLLHFVVQEIIRIEGARVSNTTANHDESQCRKLGLQVVSSLSSSLSNVKLAASMDSEVLKGDVIRLSNGIANVIDVVRLIRESNEKKFCDTMNKFLKMAQEEVFKVKAQEGVSLSLVKEITEYFHGNSAKFEAHPFRMFMVVRDFLTVLDRVCKEVGSMNDRTMLGFAQKAPVAVNQMPVFDGFHGRRQYSSSDDESSSSL